MEQSNLLLEMRTRVAEIISERKHTHALSFAERSFPSRVLSGFMIQNYIKRTRKQPELPLEKWSTGQSQQVSLLGNWAEPLDTAYFLTFPAKIQLRIKKKKQPSTVEYTLSERGEQGASA